LAVSPSYALHSSADEWSQVTLNLAAQAVDSVLTLRITDTEEVAMAAVPGNLPAQCGAPVAGNADDGHPLTTIVCQLGTGEGTLTFDVKSPPVTTYEATIDAAGNDDPAPGNNRATFTVQDGSV
jgi:hypothetical protein